MTTQTPTEHARTSAVSRTVPLRGGLLGAVGRRRLVVLAGRSLIFLGVLGGWQIASATDDSVRLALSDPQSVAGWIVSWLRGDEPSGIGALGHTLWAALVGGLLGVAAGIVLAVVITPLDKIRGLFTPLVTVLNAVPKIALAPLFVFLFGLGLTASVYYIAAAVVFIEYFGVSAGIRSVNPLLTQHVRLLGGGRWALAREVYLPTIVSWLFAGLRLCVTWAITSAVVIEYLGSTSGLGYVIASAQQISDVAAVIGGLIVVSAVAVVIDQVVVAVDRRALSWRDA